MKNTNTPKLSGSTSMSSPIPLTSGNYEVQVDEDGIRPMKTVKRTSCPWLPVICCVFILGGIGAGIAIAAKKGTFSHSSDSANGEVTPIPASCPDVPPSKRFVMFWQTEQEGCESIPDGVTHVAWGFSLVGKGDSMAAPNFQGDPRTLKNCISLLHKRCIRSLASVGGASNKDDMATISDYEKFAASVLTVVQTYGFDGIDIDDETVSTEFKKDRVEGYMAAVNAKLKTGGNNYILTFDGLAFEANDTKCTDPALAPYVRCLPNIAQYVDWVHVLAYNVGADAAEAQPIYANAIQYLFTPFVQKIGNAAKVNIGVCVGSGCAYGPGPDSKTIDSWVQYSRNHGGMMIYSGSSDMEKSFATSKQIIKDLQ